MQGSEPSASQLMGDSSSASLHHNSQRAAGCQNLNVKPQRTRTQRRSSLEVFGSSSSSTTTTLSSNGYHSGNSAHMGTYPLWGYDDNEQQQPNNIMQLFAAAKSELLYPVQTTAQKTSCTDEISDMIVEDTQEQMILELNPDEKDVFSGGQQQQDLHNSPTVEKVMKWERSPEREELTEAVMAERAAGWGLVLKSDSVTGKICGVRTRKLSGDRSSSSTGSDSRRRSSGNWTSEPGTSSTRTSMSTSTTSMCTSITSMRTSETSTRSSEASDTGSTNLSSMMRSLLPLLSHELKDVLSKFEHAFVVSDATRREFPIIYASAGFFSLTGYSPQEVIGQNCRFLQGPGTDKKEVAKIRESIAAGKSFCGCILNYKKDGSRFWNLLSMTPIKSSDGRQVLKYIGMQVEVSKYTKDKREKMMRPNGLSESLIQYDSRLQDKAMESVTELAAVFQKQRHPTIVQIESQLSNVVEGMTVGDEAPRKTRRSSGFLSLLGFFRKSSSSHEKEHMDTREIVMKAHGLHYKSSTEEVIGRNCRLALQDFKNFCKDLAKLIALVEKIQDAIDTSNDIVVLSVKENAETVKAAGWNLPDANTESLVMHVHFMFSTFNFCKVPNGWLQSIMKSLERLLEFFRNNQIRRFVKFDVQKTKKNQNWLFFDYKFSKTQNQGLFTKSNTCTTLVVYSDILVLSNNQQYPHSSEDISLDCYCNLS